MAIDAPIVILGIPRSGSSLVAGLFAAHGVWTGHCRAADDFNQTGYWENLDIKRILIRRWGRLAQGTRAALEQPGFREEIGKLKPTDPWLAKHSALYWRAWFEFKPRYVCVRRTLEGVLGSNRKVGFLGTVDEDRMRAIIAAHAACMDASGGINVYPDELLKGNYTSIQRALRACDLEPDLAKIDNHIRPDLWQRWSR